MDFSDPEMIGYLIQGCWAFMVVSVLSVVFGMVLHARGHNVGLGAAIIAAASMGLSMFCLSLAAGLNDNTFATLVGAAMALACLVVFLALVLPESIFDKAHRR